jgi:hypothetical protein
VLTRRAFISVAVATGAGVTFTLLGGCSDSPRPRPPRTPAILMVYADGHGKYPTLDSALAAAFPGDTIYLNPGQYTSAAQSFTNFRFGAGWGNVTISGVPGEAQPQVTAMKFNGCQGIDIVGLNFVDANVTYMPACAIQNSPTEVSDHIRVIGCTFTGVGNFQAGVSVYELGSQTSTSPATHGGIYCHNLGWPSNIQIIGNTMQGMSQNNVQIYGGQNVYVAKNKLLTTLNTTAHDDGIQLAAAVGVIVCNNQIYGSFSDRFTQGPNSAIIMGGGDNGYSTDESDPQPQAVYWFVQDVNVFLNQIAWTGPGIVLGGGVDRVFICCNSQYQSQIYFPFSSAPGSSLTEVAGALQLNNKNLAAWHFPSNSQPNNVGIQVRNNAFYDSIEITRYAGSAYPDPNPDEDYDIAAGGFEGVPAGPHSLTANPLFVGPRSKLDYSLQAGSPARGRGIQAFTSNVEGFAADPTLGNSGRLPAVDFFGNPWTNPPDMGSVQSSDGA